MRRKLNVALTRARQHVVILGNEEILRVNGIYGGLIDFCGGNDVLINRLDDLGSYLGDLNLNNIL